MDTTRSSTDLPAVEQVLLKIVRTIVDDAAAVHIEVFPLATGRLICVRVAPAETEKLIGRHGSTVQALRTILAAIGVKQRHAIKLRIVEPEDAD